MLPQKRLNQRNCVIAPIARAVLASSGVLLTARAGATEADWVSGVYGSWTDGTHWSTAPNYPNNGNPNGGDAYDVVIAAPGAPFPYTVSLDARLTPTDVVNVNSVTIGSSSATLLLNAGIL